MTSKNNNPQQEPEQQPKSVPAADNTPQDKTDKASTTDSTMAAPTNTEAKPQSQPDSTPVFEEKQGKRGVKLGTIAIVLAVLFGGGLTLHSQQQQAEYQAQIQALRAELEQTRSSINEQLDATKQEALSKTTEMTHRAEVVLAQQQKSIESLQLAVADMKGRRPNDWLLAEADYLVKLAGRKLFLEHDVDSATQLMESADQRIAALNDPSLTPLRKAMANDITTLKAIPLLDRDGLVLRLTSLQQQVDHLPLANAILPDAPQETEQAVSEDINNWQQNLMTSLKDFADNFITFRTRDGNVVPLLSPQQHFYLKENLKAKLETAIKSVYTEQQEIYTVSLTTADQWSKSFFNQSDNRVKTFNQTLEQLAKQQVQVEYPVKLETQKQLADVITERLRRSVSSMTTEAN
ncbi:uroporphyrinogen-III C-methyltransferase [Vibrio fluvialis]|uniref:uroporphyrinogen-III C-methyltransferase n=1 Tax=Vibrio fluvialis TaxID=676 RepID=UPI001EEAB263|nr:uroporphyrinogen-III C-methyltransferase [Vibrio fluvialis]MCG6347151.1 uroporphyrinogen-III C-methyltransferase [Vibrio fluvialis]